MRLVFGCIYFPILLDLENFSKNFPILRDLENFHENFLN